MDNYRRGLAAGIPIALGYLSVSFTFFNDNSHVSRAICRARDNDASGSVFSDADLADHY